MTIKVLAISGSLRKASFNTLALRAAAELAPEGMEVTLYDGLRDIPLYDDAPAAAIRRRSRPFAPRSRRPMRC
jgi:chromate reductase